jgi:hypothetical protein
MTTNTAILITRRPCEGRGPSQQRSAKIRYQPITRPSALFHTYLQRALYRLHPNTSPTALQLTPAESPLGFPRHAQPQPEYRSIGFQSALSLYRHWLLWQYPTPLSNARRGGDAFAPTASPPALP